MTNNSKKIFKNQTTFLNAAIEVPVKQHFEAKKNKRHSTQYRQCTKLNLFFIYSDEKYPFWLRAIDCRAYLT